MNEGSMKIMMELSANAAKLRDGLRDGSRHVSDFVQHATSQIGLLGTAMTALGTGLVLKKLFSLRDFMPIDASILMMKANLKATAEEADELKTRLISMAGSAGQDMQQLFASAKKLSIAYKPDDIMQIMAASASSAKAMEADLDTVTDRVVQMMKIYRLAPSEAKGVADAIVASRANLEQLDTILQRLALRGGSKKAYTETLGFLLGLSKAGMSNPRVVGQVNEVLDALQSKADVLQHSGIKMFDIDAKTGEKNWRDQIEVLKDLQVYLEKHKKTLSSKEYKEGLNKIFGENAERKLDFVFKQIEAFKAGIKDMGNAGEIAAKRLEGATETWGHQFDKIKGNLDAIKMDLGWLYDLAKKPVKFLADSSGLTKGAAYGAAGLSTAVLLGLGYGKIKNVLGSLGKMGGGIAAGKAVEAATGVTPVFITNWPAGGLFPGGGITPVPGGDTVKSTAAKVLPWLVVLAANPVTLAIGGTAALAFMTYKHPELADMAEAHLYDDHRDVHESHEEILQKSFSSMKPPEVKNDIQMNIRIDKDDRVWAETSDWFTKIGINLERGAF
jgi:TP901 family phage tail tape measure protein